MICQDCGNPGAHACIGSAPNWTPEAESKLKKAVSGIFRTDPPTQQPCYWPIAANGFEVDFDGIFSFFKPFRLAHGIKAIARATMLEF